MTTCLWRVTRTLGVGLIDKPKCCRYREVQSLIMEIRRLTVQEIVYEVGNSTGSTHSILNEDLVMHRVAAKLCPNCFYQNGDNLLHVSEDMLQSTNRDPEFLKTGHW